MLRRKARWRAEVDLFPFLTILACTLGVLLMVAVTLICGRVANVPEHWAMSGESKLEPQLILWEGTRVLIDSPQGPIAVPWSAASANGGINDTAFGKLFQNAIANRTSRYILIAVRPSGFESFYAVATMIREKGVRVGYWPIPQEKVVSLHTLDKGG